MTDWESKEPEKKTETPSEEQEKKPSEGTAEPEPEAAEKEAPKEEPKAEEAPKEEPKAEDGGDKDGEPASDAKAYAEPMVPRAVLGKVAKSIRDRAKTDAELYSDRIKALEAENKKLKDAPAPTSEWANADVPAQGTETMEQIQIAAREAARVEFLTRQELYGRKKYGKDYEDALLLVKNQNDPALTNRILESPNPADSLVEEAVRIAEDAEYGSNPVEREKNKQAAQKAKWRKEWEAEMAEKFSGRKNQPTDVANVRAAGGNESATPIQDSWATSLRKSP